MKLRILVPGLYLLAQTLISSSALAADKHEGLEWSENLAEDLAIDASAGTEELVEIILKAQSKLLERFAPFMKDLPGDPRTDPQVRTQALVNRLSDHVKVFGSSVEDLNGSFDYLVKSVEILFTAMTFESESEDEYFQFLYKLGQVHYPFEVNYADVRLLAVSLSEVAKDLAGTDAKKLEIVRTLRLVLYLSPAPSIVVTPDMTFEEFKVSFKEAIGM